MCRDCVSTTSITKIFEGGFNMKAVMPDVNFLKECNRSRYDRSKIFTAHKSSAVSKVISYSGTLIMNPQITRSA